MSGKNIRMMLAAASTLLASLSLAHAEDSSLLRLRETKVQFKHFVYPGRDPLFLTSPQTNELNLHVNTDVLGVLFWNNMVHSKTDDKQFRVIGWNFTAGIHVHPLLDIQWEHYSKHMLDSVHPTLSGFPYEDSIGAVLYLYRAPATSRSLF